MLGARYGKLDEGRLEAGARQRGVEDLSRVAQGCGRENRVLSARDQHLFAEVAHGGERAGLTQHGSLARIDDSVFAGASVEGSRADHSWAHRLIAAGHHDQTARAGVTECFAAERVWVAATAEQIASAPARPEHEVEPLILTLAVADERLIGGVSLRAGFHGEQPRRQCELHTLRSQRQILTRGRAGRKVAQSRQAHPCRCRNRACRQCVHRQRSRDLARCGGRAATKKRNERNGATMTGRDVSADLRQIRARA